MWRQDGVVVRSGCPQVALFRVGLFWDFSESSRTLGHALDALALQRESMLSGGGFK